MLKRIKTKWWELINSIQNYSFNRFWNKKIEHALKSFTVDEQKIILPVLKNQLEYLKTERFTSPKDTFKGSDEYASMVFDVVVEMFKNLRPVFSVVGVQPLQGPIGLVYQMAYSYLTTEDQASTNRKVGLQVISHAIQARPRKLQARWTIEAMQDLKAQHGLDFKQEMVSALGAELACDVAQEVINDLKTLSTTKHSIDFDSNNLKESVDLIFVKLNMVMNEIARKTRRGPGNFVICGPALISMLSLYKDSYEKIETVETNCGGLCHVANIVYTDTYKLPIYESLSLAEDVFLVGYKGGNGQLDTGYVYCPYVPLMLSSPVIDPETFQPLMVSFTRHGKATMPATENYISSSGNYYGILEINNFSFK